MYKLGGRGGGRGGGGAAKRPPAPHGRGRGGASSVGGMGAPPRDRAASAATVAAQPAGRDEAFRLESGGPPAFGAIIRLTPDLVDEIRRAEEAGGGARIKFNPNMYNSSENVIDVGGKEFKFTWASERGELCDIYEERQSGEDGNGLFMECGSAWRKVNVQRILDESAKNLVKMRSEEAERLSKSRKSIVLDPGNPSVKSQAKSMAAAAVEGNMRRMHWKHKKEFFKKNQGSNPVPSPAVIAPTKSVSKVKLSNNTPKRNFSTSPAPSPEPGASMPSFPVGSDANNELITSFDLNKEDNNKIEKVTPSKISRGINCRANAPSASVEDNTSEVRNLLTSVLSENPKGMNLKALEKAVADAFPNASKKIESVIKNIAIFQAPGRYVLKQGLEIESSKRNLSEGGRSIDENTEEAAPSLKIDDPDIFETIDIEGSPVAVAGDPKVNNDSDAKAGSSSESGSDSDSDSSDSGSDSGSQSRSAAESGSGSSSDSDSDASSSSKEGSDAFVDITSDDDKTNTAHTKLADDLNLSSSPKDLTGLDVDDEQIDIGTNLDYRSTSPHIDQNNFNTDNDDAAHTVAASEGLDASDKLTEIPGNENMTSTRMDPIEVDGNYNEMSLQDNPFDDPLRTFSENLSKEEPGLLTKHHGSRRKSTSKDGSNHGLMSSVEKSAKSKLKRGSGNENSTAKPVSSKKAKVDITSADTTVSFSEQKKSLPLDKKSNDRLNKEIGSVGRDASQNSSPAAKGRSLASGNSQKIDHSPNVSIPVMHSERENENIEKSRSKKKADKMQKWPMHGDFGTGYSHGEDHHVNFDGSDYSSTRKRSRHGDLVDDKMLKCSKNANVNVNSMNSRTSKGNVGPVGIMTFPESNESNGKPSNPQRDNVERSPHGKKILQRELSDLELGEFRETSLENDNGRTRKQFERNSSSKSLDGKSTTANNLHTSMNNRKGPLTAFHDKSKPSPQDYVTGGHINQEGIQRKAPRYDFDDNRPQQRGNVPESQHLPRTDNSDSENIFYPDKSGEKKSKRETRMTHGGMLEYADKKKKPDSRLPQNGSKNVVVPRTQKSISPSDNEERSRNNSLIETDKGRKRRDSSSDEDDLFFSKYDKDEPELKGPIKDFSQYKNYVQEYHEKYEVYSYLNGQLEKTKSEFLKVEEDLSVAKERDKEQYYNILERLREMYRESVGRHKLMKKVFVLLHEELQAIKQRINDFLEAYSNE